MNGKKHIKITGPICDTNSVKPENLKSIKNLRYKQIKCPKSLLYLIFISICFMKFLDSEIDFNLNC